MADSNFSSIKNIIRLISASFTKAQEPIAPLPAPTILAGSNLRPGLSPSKIASRIISRLSEAGLPVGDVFDDGPNKFEALLVIIIEEVIIALQTESVVNVAIPPGVGVTTLGVGNLGAPVLSNGVTTTPSVGNGIIR